VAVRIDAIEIAAATVFLKVSGRADACDGAGARGPDRRQKARHQGPEIGQPIGFAWRTITAIECSNKFC
jgi:hypothetical protein